MQPRRGVDLRMSGFGRGGSRPWSAGKKKTRLGMIRAREVVFYKNHDTAFLCVVKRWRYGGAVWKDPASPAPKAARRCRETNGKGRPAGTAVGPLGGNLAGRRNPARYLSDNWNLTLPAPYFKGNPLLRRWDMKTGGLCQYTKSPHKNPHGRYERVSGCRHRSVADEPGIATQGIVNQNLFVG